jgi:hypothetical protein
MILNKEEVEDLIRLLDGVQCFIKDTEMEKTNVGMVLYEKSNKWLTKLETRESDLFEV